MSEIVKSNFKVLVHCVTYNQAEFIDSALDGFAGQRTDFPYICVVIDDSSTDGEQDVIKSYIENECEVDSSKCTTDENTSLIFARHKINTNCSFAFYLLKKNMFHDPVAKDAYFNSWREGCHFEAFCDGDDYWIDSNKLQKQVEFLEKNSEYSLCFHNVKVQKGNDFLSESLVRDVPGTSTIIDLFKGNYIHTPSAMCVIDKSVNDSMATMGQVIVADYPYWILTATKGKIFKFDDVMAVYRYGVGIWSGNNDYMVTSTTWLVMLSKLSCVIDRKYQNNIALLISDKKNAIETYMTRLEQSWDYKIGTFLLRPIRWAKDLIIKRN